MAPHRGYTSLEVLFDKKILPLLGCATYGEAQAQFVLEPLIKQLVRSVEVEGVKYYLLNPRLSASEREALVNAYRKQEPTEAPLGRCDRCCAPARVTTDHRTGRLYWCNHHAREYGFLTSIG